MNNALNKYTGVNGNARNIDIRFKYGKPVKGTGSISYLTKTVNLNSKISKSDLYRIAGVISNIHPENLRLILSGIQVINETPLEKFKNTTEPLNMYIVPKLRSGPPQNSVIKEQQELNTRYSSNKEKAITATIKKEYNISGGNRKTIRNRKNNRKTLRRHK